MSTARDLIKDSMRKFGGVATGETPSADEIADGLRCLNSMLDSWSAEGLLIYATVREEFTLTPSQQAYEIGDGGDFDTTRPVEIKRAAIEVQSGDTPEYPVDIITLDEWAMIGVKNTQSEIPTKLYIEGTMPLDTYNLWPVPSAANKLVIYSHKVLTAVANANTTIELPPGYEDAIVHNHAVRFAPEFEKSVSAEIAEIARDSKANIKRSNIKPVYLTSDEAVCGARPFNIFTFGR